MSAPRVCSKCDAEVAGFHSYQRGWKCDACKGTVKVRVEFELEVDADALVEEHGLLDAADVADWVTDVIHSESSRMFAALR